MKIWLILLAVLLALTDWFSKVKIGELIQTNAIEVNRFLVIEGVWNSGVAFSFFQDRGKWIMAFATLAAIGILIAMVRTSSKKYALGLALILGGAAGNTIDRAIHGAVYDFISLHIGHHYWPTFNLADSYICIGVGVCFFGELIRIKN